jgi:two-component system sensor histidine kinase HydH
MPELREQFRTLMATVALLFYRLIRVFSRMERSSAHRDRLEAMGTLAAGIAHEIRNPLGIIRALAEALRGDLKADDPGQEMLGDLLDEVQRLNNLVTQYLAFARPDAVGAEGSCHPEAIARSLATLLEKGEKGTAHPMELEIAESLPEVRMNPNALRQVLINLLINAREASPPGSPVRVQCQARRGGAQLAIRVSDRGAGIAPKELRRIFDPFYTTKSGGSGLGLSICRRLVENADGTISVESQLGQGTTVQVVLPAGRG